MLASKEGHDVEYKCSVNALESSDIVAFANSDSGGAVLLGVAEESDSKGIQEVKIVGCDIGDKEKQAIISKAQSCTPPISVEVFVENYSRKPFLRVEIPSGPEKPYCTAGGTYKIRGDGRAGAILPTKLLSMFIETESTRFFHRFKEATRELEEELKDLKSKLSAEIKNVYKDIRSARKSSKPLRKK